MHERYGMMGLAFACVALACSTPTPEEQAERDARRARERAEADAREAARHPATKSKPKSASLQRMLRKR